MSGGEFAAIEARASAVADAFHDDVPLELETYVWKYAPGQQKYFTSIQGEQGDIAAIEGWDDDATATIEALIGAVNVAREDIPALLAAVRERDNTIARVREVLDDYDGLNAEPIPKLSTHTWMHQVRAALDPQETPDGRM